MDPWDQDQRGQGREESLHLHVVPMTQGGLGESHQQGMQGKSQGQLEGGTHLDHLVRTSHYLLLADLLRKAYLDKAQGEHQGRRGKVLLGKERGLQVAVLELPQVGSAQGTARGTAQGLQDWKGTALALLVQVGIVQVSQDQRETHQELQEALGIVLAHQDQRDMDTAPVPRVQIVHQQSQPEQRAGWELLGLNLAILGLQKVEGYWQGQTG